jgi:3-hydroxyisobutyrate dehydrogenase-like beta-hydroxyacid dehydrogenase
VVELALLGLGPMGLPIASRLGGAGVEVLTWNRTPHRTPELPSLREVSTPFAAAAPVVLTVLPDLPEVEEVLAGPTGLLAGWRERHIANPILVVHGTVAPDRVTEFAHRLRTSESVTVVDAPMSGGTIGAAEGTLTLMVGGDEDVISSLRPTFSHYARDVGRLGTVGSGSLGKVCNQIIVAGTIAAISEAVNLARRSDLDIELLMRLLQNGLAGSEVLRQKANNWIGEDYRPGGSARNQLKDLRFARGVGARTGSALSVTTAVEALFAEMVERGDGSLDHTGVIRAIAAASTDEVS